MRWSFVREDKGFLTVEFVFFDEDTAYAVSIATVESEK